MPLGLDPTVPLDSRLHLLGYRTGPRTAAAAGPGSLFNPTVGTTQTITPKFRYDHPATSAERFPLFFFGADAPATANGQVVECEEANIVLWTLCHAAAPWAGEDPWLCVLDFWLAWVKPRNHKSMRDAAQASAIALTEDDVNNSSLSINDGRYYGAKLGITGGGSVAGSPAGSVDDLMLFAAPENHVDRQRHRWMNPGLGPPVHEEWHRWTIVAKTRNAAANPGFARFYYDQRLVWDVPREDLPKAATYFHGFAAAGPNADGTEMGFKIAHLQAYHTRDLAFLPWRPPLRVRIERRVLGQFLEDDFNRADSNTLGNGWTEVEAAATDLTISGNRARHAAVLRTDGFYRNDVTLPRTHVVHSLIWFSATASLQVATRKNAINAVATDRYEFGFDRSLQRWRLNYVRGGAVQPGYPVDFSENLTTGVDYLARLIVIDNGDGTITLEGWGRVGTTWALKCSKVESNPLPDTHLGFGCQAWQNGQWDNFIATGLSVRIRGLRPGWKAQLPGEGAPVAAGPSGEVTLNFDRTGSLKPMALLVLDENNAQIGAIFPDGGIRSGDEYEVVP